MNTRKFLSAMAIGSILLTSCSNDDDNPAPINEEEVITTMTITLQNGPETVTLQVKDEDGGDGPKEPVITVSGDLKANTEYAGTVVLLNETETPAENINEEIEEEADAHQFFYEVEDKLGITVTYNDKESDYITNGGEDPVGLKFVVKTTAAAEGTFTATLKHEPKKPNNGTVTDAGGETDIAQAFSIKVVE
ncbi:type 1 periplasmic binding fold superfamily protein [Aquimarina sp. TRL1]|uniref:type 1 periplasmic binding fold superfamily protein n=1 Tax=Aquimarina sp. (strain TRL1) TaxID=2736252 RepID=UPI00158AF4D0|nr:type 1 periplasmic binding fold superfamily protein [Aquimarina sp. TRL1]QKX04610.1 type 1 periplasmic binding fold superfamily protein [Aquimarina sp. TRL1]